MGSIFTKCTQCINGRSDCSSKCFVFFGKMKNKSEHENSQGKLNTYSRVSVDPRIYPA